MKFSLKHGWVDTPTSIDGRMWLMSDEIAPENRGRWSSVAGLWPCVATVVFSCVESRPWQPFTALVACRGWLGSC
ncbi:hypothetical protein BVRB_8g197140 [Beta vulgaris subsp. vulgaris]|nr:hypothetical protein BVRB_8g197140 [Beta vulgaris subsp. vulgaris]